jgi:excisionase family DNA binding protein
MGTVVDGADPSQAGGTITGGEGDGVQPSQGFAANERNFTTHLLPESGTASGATTATVGATRDEVPGWGHVAPGTAPRVRTTPTTADLVSYWGGRHRLLRVREVAEQLGVCNATVYRLVETGDLPHVRIVNSIRIRPDDLSAFLEKEASEGSTPDG